MTWVVLIGTRRSGSQHRLSPYDVGCFLYNLLCFRGTLKFIYAPIVKWSNTGDLQSPGTGSNPVGSTKVKYLTFQKRG